MTPRAAAVILPTGARSRARPSTGSTQTPRSTPRFVSTTICSAILSRTAADKNFLDCINPDSLKVLTGCKVEAGLGKLAMPEKGKDSESFQFMRQGYFCLDNRDATPEHLVFNRAVALKDSFKK